MGCILTKAIRYEKCARLYIRSHSFNNNLLVHKKYTFESKKRNILIQKIR